MSFLRIENLNICLKEFHLKNISFDMEGGDYLTIIGPTGAGKTILLESIIGFWKINQGHIFIDNVEITNDLPEDRQMGIVYQDYALFPHFTVSQNIAYGLKKKDRKADESQVTEIATSLQIDHLLHRKPGTLSGGEKQRTALARALIVAPKLLLMDEPFSALDPKTRRTTRQLLKSAIEKNGTTVIHITHDLEDAWSMANKTAFFKEGNLLQFGPLEDIFFRPNSGFIADFVGASIFEGQVQERLNGNSIINCNGFSLTSLDTAEVGKKVQVAVRPESIIVSRNQPSSDISAQNILKTELSGIVDEGRSCLLDLQINGSCINGLVAKNTVSRMNLSIGDTLFAIIKSANVRII